MKRISNWYCVWIFFTLLPFVREIMRFVPRFARYDTPKWIKKLVAWVKCTNHAGLICSTHRYYAVRNIAAGHDVSKPLIHDVAVQDNRGDRMQFNAFRRVTIHNVSTDKRDKLAFIRKFLIVWVYKIIYRRHLLEISRRKILNISTTFFKYLSIIFDLLRFWKE